MQDVYDPVGILENGNNLKDCHSYILEPDCIPDCIPNCMPSCMPDCMSDCLPDYTGTYRLEGTRYLVLHSSFYHSIRG